MDFKKEIEQLINLALAEDIRSGDITSLACITPQATMSGKLLLKQAGVLAGLPFIPFIFQKVDPLIEVLLFTTEGSYQKAGTIIGKVTGPARGMISAERVVLNLIQHASGVATITAAYVKKVAGYQCDIVDTRKTLPGLRALEKYAVLVGGGKNHRNGLDDRFIIKRNHLSLIAQKAQYPIKQAIHLVKSSPYYQANIPIEVEIESFEQLEEALQTEASLIMLTHMTPIEVEACVKKIAKTHKRAYVESGSSITLDTIRAYADTGVHGISIGALTHSVNALDISLRITP